MSLSFEACTTVAPSESCLFVTVQCKVCLLHPFVRIRVDMDRIGGGDARGRLPSAIQPESTGKACSKSLRDGITVRHTMSSRTIYGTGAFCDIEVNPQYKLTPRPDSDCHHRKDHDSKSA